MAMFFWTSPATTRPGISRSATPALPRVRQADQALARGDQSARVDQESGPWRVGVQIDTTLSCHATTTADALASTAAASRVSAPVAARNLRVRRRQFSVVTRPAGTSSVCVHS
jgi:hypothetical protein